MAYKKLLSLALAIAIVGLTAGQAKALNRETEILKDNFSLKFKTLERIKEDNLEEILTVRFDAKDTNISTMSFYNKNNNTGYHIYIGIRDKNSLIGLKYYLEMTLINDKLHINKDYNQELKALLNRKNLPEQEQYIIYDGEFYDGVMKLKELFQSDTAIHIDTLIEILKFFDDRIKGENKNIEYQEYVTGGYESSKIDFDGDTLYLRYKTKNLDHIFKDLEKVLEKQ